MSPRKSEQRDSGMTRWKIDRHLIVDEKGRRVCDWTSGDHGEFESSFTEKEQYANALLLAAAPAAVESLQAIAKALVRGQIVVDVSPDMSTNIMLFSKLMNEALVALTAAGINTEDLHR